MSPSPSTAVIIINYKRPQNIGRIVSAAAEALPASPIHVIDHGEGPCSLIGREDIPWDRCWLRTQPNAGPGVRVQIAAHGPFDHYLCIDDDTFLDADQIKRLMLRLEIEPERAHGVTGQMLRRGPEGAYSLEDCISYPTFVTVLNRVYAFTRARAAAALKLAELVGYDRWEAVTRTDDILLSSAGALPCRVHDLGRFGVCSTSAADGIAIHRGEGFHDERITLMQHLIDINMIYIEDIGGDAVSSMPVEGRAKS